MMGLMPLWLGRQRTCRSSWEQFFPRSADHYRRFLCWEPDRQRYL